MRELANNETIFCRKNLKLMKYLISMKNNRITSRQFKDESWRKIRVVDSNNDVFSGNRYRFKSKGKVLENILIYQVLEIYCAALIKKDKWNFLLQRQLNWGQQSRSINQQSYDI